MNPSSFSTVFAELESSRTLSAETARGAFDAILAGEWTASAIGALLAALRMVPDNATVLTAAVTSMRSNMLAVDHGLDQVLDTCGTGGDGQGTLNLSSGAAILAASCGARVAKHGNRAVSSRAGSADVLEQLGITLSLPAEASARLLREIGICFLLAPQHHPAMRHAAPVRRELQIRTVFNALGPLANPARATHQLVGAFSNSIRPILAEVLGAVGVDMAWVVHGHDGLDEVSPCDTTWVTQVDHGRLEELEIAPEDFGMKRLSSQTIRGGTAIENAATLRQVLANTGHPATDAFLINAAAALVLLKGLRPKNAMDCVRQALAEGKAIAKLEAWREASQAAGAEIGS